MTYSDGVTHVVRKNRLRTTTGLLLSAAVLLGSIVPPGQRHAHAAGDVPHNHDKQHAHDHSGDAHHHHTTDQHGLSTPAVKPAAVAHVHFACWLFDLTMPVRDESETEDNQPLYLVRLIDDCLPTTISGPNTHPVDMPSHLQSIAVDRPALARRATAPPDTAVLLCDAARHERSGVQLL
jgi:hypothetical protein